jgi:hypothetical protein
MARRSPWFRENHLKIKMENWNQNLIAKGKK